MQMPEVVVCVDDDDVVPTISMEPGKEENWMRDCPTQPKVFALAGFTPDGKLYTAKVMEQEKKNVINKIETLGGRYLDEDIWKDEITHVVYFTRHESSGMTEKVMAALAAGRWVVTKRYVEKSFKQGSWITSLQKFVYSPRVLERRKAVYHDGALKGGLFWTMKAAFIMEDEEKNRVYSRIVTAGGGTIIRYHKTLDSLAARLPGPREITHVFLDPWPKVINSDEFQSVVVNCRNKGLSIRFLHYKYLYNLIAGTENATTDKWEVTSESVQNDVKFRMERMSAKRKRLLTMKDVEVVEQRKAKKVGTSETCTVTLEEDEETEVPTVRNIATCCDDSSDDDIQIVERRLIS